MSEAAAATCPRCGVPRADAPECPRCGVIYAKARAAAIAELPEIQGEPVWEGALDDARRELLVRAVAIPAALLLAWLAMAVGPLHALSRVFLSMWVHELGHAITAWFCGFFALPGPWFTRVDDVRGVVTPLVVAALLGVLAWRGIKMRRRSIVMTAAALFLVQLVGTLALSSSTARALVIFGGDGGCLVLGTLLVLTMYAPADSQLRIGWLRWGFLVIGAVAFADVLDTWWAAHRDFASIPFGENEGVGLSDASKLVDQMGWDVRALIGRYLRLAGACAIVLGAAYAWGLRTARAEVRRLSRG